jgi:hypothetical protein
LGEERCIQIGTSGPLENLDDVFGVDADGFVFAEEKYHVEIFGGTEIARVSEKISRAIRESNTERAKRLATSDSL